MYKPDSNSAEEFIAQEEIQSTLQEVAENKNNRKLLQDIMRKAEQCKGLNHREAALLLECTDQEINQQINQLARSIKQKFFRNIFWFREINILLISQ